MQSTSTIATALVATYIEALRHSQNNTATAHLACSIVVNDVIVSTSSNTPTYHAEVEALRAIAATSIGTEKLPCEKGRRTDTSAQKRNHWHVQTLYRLLAHTEGFWF